VAQCSNSPVNIRPPPTSSEVGYISGLYPATTSGLCPTSAYELRAAPGQRWNISLLDFAATSADTGTGNGDVAEEGEGGKGVWESAGAVCRRYAIIREELRDDEDDIIAGSGYNNNNNNNYYCNSFFFFFFFFDYYYYYYYYY